MVKKPERVALKIQIKKVPGINPEKNIAILAIMLSPNDHELAEKHSFNAEALYEIAIMLSPNDHELAEQGSFNAAALYEIAQYFTRELQLKEVPLKDVLPKGSKIIGDLSPLFTSKNHSSKADAKILPKKAEVVDFSGCDLREAYVAPEVFLLLKFDPSNPPILRDDQQIAYKNLIEKRNEINAIVDSERGLAGPSEEVKNARNTKPPVVKI